MKYGGVLEIGVIYRSFGHKSHEENLGFGAFRGFGGILALGDVFKSKF